MDLPAALGAFPPVELAFAYGSGVFTQAGYEAPSGKPGGPAPPMVDLVFAVADPLSWHAANLAAHREHYSGLGALGPAAVAAVQAAGGGRLYYNTLVPLPPAARGLPGQAMKYGVISTAHLLDDLLHWRHLYVAGRLHKPVRLLACTQPAILAAARENLRHALRAALLMLPARFTATQLYTVRACAPGCCRVGRLPRGGAGPVA
jgi:mitochondrial translocator assembly and maintenance protein 41